MNLSHKTSQNRTGYAFASPWLIGFLFLTLVPMVGSILLSFVKWNGINLSQMEWVGLENYRRAFEDENVRIALWNTFYYSFLAVPLGLMCSLILAVLLNQKLPGIPIFRTLFYMPHVVGGIATIMMWMWVFQPDFGLLNTFLRACADWLAQLGLIERGWQPPKWLYDPAWSKPALIIMSLWGAGGAMLIFLAALQNVPDQLYEAAKIDGATRFQQFWHITIPQITSAIFFNLVMGIIGSFQVFNEAFIISKGTGGPSRSTLFYVLYLYIKGFLDFEMGYASALAWILCLIILAFTLLIIRSSSKWVYYEGEKS
jgi:multiple sugar transport system permease protein